MGFYKTVRLTPAPADSGSAARAKARFARDGAIIEKELSSATHVPRGCCAIAETADTPRTGTRGGLKPPRLVASSAAATEPNR